MKGLIGIVVLLALMLAVTPARAEDGRVPLPSLAAAKGEACVEPADIMRRYHMVFLKHQRTETMRQGIRGGKYSLKECVECHAAPDPAAGGQPTIEPFCGECHAYAAVTIDCFECHSDRPAAASSASRETLVGQLRACLGEDR